MFDSIGVEIPVTSRVAALVEGRLSKVLSIDLIRDGEVFETWRGVTCEWEPSHVRQVQVRIAVDEDGCALLKLPSFSVPKFVYGHNVYLLYDLQAGLAKVRAALIRDFSLPASEVGDVAGWRVTRVDLCYAYQVGDRAHLLMQYLKTFAYPRKEGRLYKDSIMFVGSTYSFKLYLKEPEFMVHDFKALRKGGADLEAFAVDVAKKSRGVFRVEATLRKRAIVQQLGKAPGSVVYVGELTGEWAQGVLAGYVRRFTMNMRTEATELEVCMQRLEEHFGKRRDGQNQVARYMGFYLLAVRVGRERVKELMAPRTYYYQMKQLREAGVSIIGFDELTDDLRNFVLDVPSDLVVNGEDLEGEMDRWERLTA